MSKLRLIITSVISIVLVSILLIGSTYSIFTTTEIDEELNVYKTGDLNIKYSSNNVKITDVTPMTIEEADSVIPHRLTVTNSGNVPYMFDLILTDTTSSDSNTIDYQYIMTKVGYLEPKALSNCTNNIIKEDIILLPGKSIDIDVRIWLSDNIQNSEMGKSFYAKLSIDGQAVYNDNEEIDNDILSLNYMTNASASNFRSDTYITYIKTASFVDYIDTTNASIDTTTNEKIIWDMSENKNEPNSVVAWLEDNGTTDDSGNKYYDLYIGSEEKIYAKSLEGLFSRMIVLETVVFNNLDTSLTTNIGDILRECKKLTSVNLSDWNILNVTNMHHMFYNCNSLTRLDLSSFDTSNVTSMQSMFSGCSSLIELNLSNFDTSKVTDMKHMFNGCSSLTELDLSNFDTSNVTSMLYMFNGSSSLITLDVSKFNTSNVTEMKAMFSRCSSLTELDLSNFDTSNVTTMDSMFSTCSSLTELNLSNFDTSNVTNMGWIFEYCSNLTKLDVIDFNTINVTNMDFMFRNCSSLMNLDISNWDTSNVISMKYMFYNCNKITATITIRNTSTTYSSMLNSAAIAKDSEGNYIGKITVNYIPDDPTTDTNESTEAIVDAMIATGTGNIEKGCYGTNCPVET